MKSDKRKDSAISFNLFMKNIVFILLLILSMLIALSGCSKTKHENIKELAFNALEQIRNQKKEQLIEYFSILYNKAQGITNDKTIIDFFITSVTSNLHKNSSLAHDSLERAMLNHYIDEYADFYDILFVNTSAYVFHSIRKESDYHSNFKKGELLFTKLTESLKDTKSITFVEYEQYKPSQEPAAFFVVPVSYNKTHAGWLILQCPINKINNILTDRANLGRSGEVYLVNDKNLMLTESRFSDESTILQKEIHTDAVRTALKSNSGNKLILDYRKVKVFSSFEKIEFLNVVWVIIAEIDEDEVITDYYKNNSKFFSKKFREYICNVNHKQKPSQNIFANLVKVDMKEFGIAYPGDILFTNGVTYCTALTISYPDRFVYLAHITPTDKIYTTILSRIFLKEQKTDFVTSLMERILHYKIYTSEIDRLTFTIVSINDESLANTVNELLMYEVEISQIKIMYNPKAYRVDVYADPIDGSVYVDWFYNRDNPIAYSESSSNVKDLRSIIKEIIRY